MKLLPLCFRFIIYFMNNCPFTSSAKRTVKQVNRSMMCSLAAVLVMTLWPVERGIAQSNYHWQNVAVGGGGFVTGLVIHPKEKDLVYIRTDIGGFYRWNETDKQWIPLTDHFSYSQSNYYGGESIAVDPADPDIVYIAAGTYTRRQGSIFKSNDRGETWTKLNLDVPMGGNMNLRWGEERLAVCPFDSDILLFGSRNDGIFKSSDGGGSWKSLGLIGTTTDEIGILGIMFDPTSRGTVYANVFGDGIYKSTDNGDTWKLLPGSSSGVLRMSLANNGTLYTAGRVEPKAAKMNRDGTWMNITPQKYRHTSSTPISTAMFLTLFNYCGISVDPQNSDHVIMSLDYKMPGKIYRSINGGESWTEINPTIRDTVPWWQDNYWGASIGPLVFDPQNQGQVWFTDWFGVWRTENISEKSSVWTNQVNGLEEIVAFCLIAPPSNDSMLISGMADQGGMVHSDLDSYPERKLGPPVYQDTFNLDYCAGKPSNIVRIGGNRTMDCFGDYVVSSERDPYGGATSEDGGYTWKPFGSMPSGGMPFRVAISSSDPDILILLMNQDMAYRTTDGGETWMEIASLPTSTGSTWNRLQPLAADKVNGQKFYFFDNGKFYRSSDSGKSFTVTAATLPAANARMKTAPDIEGEIWISFGTNGLYRSSDSGSSFLKVETVEKASLFAFGKPLNSMTVPAIYLFGTVKDEHGVSVNNEESIFRSLDFGKTWQSIAPLNEVGIFASPTVMEASKQHAGMVFIGTNGRGIFYGVPEK